MQIVPNRSVLNIGKNRSTFYGCLLQVAIHRSSSQLDSNRAVWYTILNPYLHVKTSGPSRCKKTTKTRPPPPATAN